MRCGLIWECPVCQLVVKTKRAAEVQQAIEWHAARFGQDCAAMLSATVRHGMGDDLRTVRQGVTRALQRFTSGAPYKRKLAEYGLTGRIRALDVTHGSNGWHPHLHIVILSERALDDAFLTWVSARWQAIVERELGAEHVPSDERGCVITPCHKADYLQKLGLEVAAPGKAGRGANLTPLQLLASAVCDGDAEALALYQDYCTAMKGARMLTWSKGLKAAAGITERTDEEIIDGEDGCPEKHVITIRGAAWDAMVRYNPSITSQLLDLAEDSSEAVREFLGQLPLWPAGYDPTAPPPEEVLNAN